MYLMFRNDVISVVNAVISTMSIPAVILLLTGDHDLPSAFIFNISTTPKHIIDWFLNAGPKQARFSDAIMGDIGDDTDRETHSRIMEERREEVEEHMLQLNNPKVIPSEYLIKSVVVLEYD
jgi:hypothetical protein